MELPKRSKLVGLVLFLSFGLLFSPLQGNGLAGKKETRPQKATQQPKQTKEKTGEEEKKEEPVFRPHEEVIVTATMTRKAVKDCSPAVTVITQEDIASLRPSNSLNILNLTPGIFVHRTGDFGRADVEIRGLGQRGTRITIMTDGRPEKMGLFGCAVTHAFPLDNVSRLEVVRGPASILYGSDALGGVINILTQKPSPGFHSNFYASYGTFNTRELNLQHGAAGKKWFYLLTYDDRASDGHVSHSQYSGRHGTGKIGWQISDHLELHLLGKYFSGKKDEPGPLHLPSAWSWNKYERGAIDLNLTGQWAKEDFQARLYRDFGHHRFSDGWHSRDTVDGVVLRLTTRHWPNNELTLGADFKLSAGRSYNFPQGKWDKEEMGLFFQNEHVLAKKLILSAGARIHRDSVAGYEFCPHLGLVFLPTETTRLRLVTNKGFRSPQLNELYMFPASNPSLKPEGVWNYELGLDKSFSRSFTAKITLFHMNGNNLIETVRNPSPPPLFRMMNTGRISLTGAELEALVYLSPSLSTIFSATYLDPKERTRGHPGKKFDWLIRWDKGPVQLILLSQYVGDYYAADFHQEKLPSYLLVNSRLTLRLSSLFSLLLDADNLLNQEYKIFADLPGTAAGVYLMPGRSLKIGLRAHL